MRVLTVAVVLGVYAPPLLSLAHSADHPETASTLPLAFAIIAGIVAGLVGAGMVYRVRKNMPVALAAGITLSALVGGSVFFVPPSTETPLATGAHPELAGVPMEVFKSPGCSCCDGFISELKKQAAVVTVREVTDEELLDTKRRFGVSSDLESCHTTLVNGYVVEGHVPLAVMAQLLEEKPQIDGIALPGMPSGTPGMPGPKTEPYRIQTLGGDEYLVI